MHRTWSPSQTGGVLTGSKRWQLWLEDERALLEVEGARHAIALKDLGAVHVEPGLLWSRVTVTLPNRSVLELDGIGNAAARDMVQAISCAREQALARRRLEQEKRQQRKREQQRLEQTRQEQERAQQLLRSLQECLSPVVEWAQACRAACKAQLAGSGWLTRDFIARQIALKPRLAAELLSHPDFTQAVAGLDARSRDALGFWQRDLAAAARATNERHLQRELQSRKDFFDAVEKTPLTPEQARAVVCLDNRVLLVASAGSGKTSTMVAKAAYVLTKRYFAAQEVLLLAFNREAAGELAQRAQDRFRRLGLQGRIAARTFHAFGLEVIGAATGRRPALAPWLEGGRDVEAVLDIVDTLKDRDAGFRANWDLFRLVLAQDMSCPGEGEDAPQLRRRGFRTLQGDTVESRGEQMLADWLFYNGVEYVYGARRRADTADASLTSHPVFHLPAIDTCLAYRALDEREAGSEQLEDDRAAMKRARDTHRQHGPALVEVTTAGLWSGEAFRDLESELTRRGIALDPNPDRPTPGRQPVEIARLARTVRSFLAHAKSNALSNKALRQRLDAGAAGHFQHRHGVFLHLFERIRQAWEERLQREGCIDYEDMLRQAGDCIEQGRWKSPYRLVMVDEFQDASQARARLVAALVREPDRCLFAVGDDWQGINRFAGADLGVMTGFEERFGAAQTLRLETTFRCPQSLCDLSSRFVMRNPQQIEKRVASARADVARPVRILCVENQGRIQAAVSQCVQALQATAPAGPAPSILVLGRYNGDRRFMPAGPGTAAPLDFMTVHASKGREADHVILPAMVTGTTGFPSRVADDPVLRLAMPDGDDFDLAEERRLFYVALTRARQSVTLVTVAGRESEFVLELVQRHGLDVERVEPEGSAPGPIGDPCPRCGTGRLAHRESRHGPFLGCSSYPQCRFTQDLALDAQKQPPPGTAVRHGRRAAA
ncbi:UvrD-helicase domain-containing protein [Azohydromonas aeria]|uniref:UvrD-helicase domain-containing protein n=1 Tax=Azohydromonas aeria TaxID=2590212 RepID=UPI0012F91BF2|nr:UvrD-helicase domain-containing protein [Azohydromonas aeria]